MKKTIALLLLFALLIACFAGCKKEAEPNTDNTSDMSDTGASDTDDTDTSSSNSQALNSTVWDGSVASAFAGGNGTEEQPYQIASASQFAFLAKEINSGKDYANKAFSLLCDLNLNNIEWSPIGNGKYSFNGNFDGQGHTITNLKISDAVKYTRIESSRTLEAGVAGLFGDCQNATICNLRIKNATISVPNIRIAEQFYLGILIGHLESTVSSTIHNVQITNSSITTYEDTMSEEKQGASCLAIGGMIGVTRITENAQCKIDMIGGNVGISCENGYKATQYLGSIIGFVSNRNIFECTNFAGYLSAKIPYKHIKNSIGAFGCTSNGNQYIKLSGGFSEIKVNQTPIIDDGYYANESHSIIGTAMQGRRGTLMPNGSYDQTVDGTYQFENLYGNVKSIDGMEEIFAPICSLYSMPNHAIFVENNCEGCLSLPEDHGLDTRVWDLGVLSAPTLKWIL